VANLSETPVSIKIGQHLLKLCTKVLWCVFMPRSVHGLAFTESTLINQSSINAVT